MKLAIALVFCIGGASIVWQPAVFSAQTAQQHSTPQTIQAPTSLDAYIAYACQRGDRSNTRQSDKEFAACVRQRGEAFDSYAKIQAQLADLAPAKAATLRADCKVSQALADAATASKALACVTAGTSAFNVSGPVLTPSTLLYNLTAPSAQPVHAGGSNPAPKSTPQDAHPEKHTFQAGEHVGTSAFRTSSTCLKAKGDDSNAYVTSSPDVIGVRRSLMDPKEASDDYGRRLGKRYIIYQIRVSNFSKDFQYVVHDISLNLRDLRRGETFEIKRPQGLSIEEFQASTRDLDFLRGVAEKGQDHDPRNTTLHTFQGINSVSAGISGLTPFSDVMGSAVSVFGGPFIQAFVALAPDHTATQLNRLSDHAFASNTLVDKLHTRVYAVFVPDSAVLNNKNQDKYWSHTRDLLDDYHLDLVDVCVDGSLVTETNVAAGPDFSLGTGNVPPASPLTLSSSDAGAVIYYSTDGSAVTASSSKYTGPITLSSTVGDTVTVQALTIAPNEVQSPVVTRVYTIAPAAPAPVITPTATPAAGGSFQVSISYGSPQISGDIYYTTDGSDPTTSSLLYKTAISVTAPKTVKAISTGPGFSNSPVTRVDFK